ncbi:diguanylate cyclase [Domibacillus sp. DTU_2020_1001157_1_SI_ALB_TIR_016]|uniref:GGDEF domain-containing protein n=1 Tax=Domibacillus sp. DTU_2020_1001157_1_SI_ALB_TIR_016 TaxID=3077789 RepID=UPI0028E95629|nr:diguanylate cyclase [Domibacillus sp. DTU_2020_1001157_1_SI_ALB_TIR_016]WNS79263.1 diguanylate cyclase [Domibacillus sp. DTU_2020_1001157_1_SI_ALB_TIR_016]
MIIIKDLFTNLAILASLLLLYSQVTKGSPLHLSSSIKRKIVVGLAGGLMGNLLMQYAMHIGNTIIDLRHIPLVLLASAGGALPTAVAAILIIAGRLFIGVNLSAFISITFIVALTVFASFVSKIQISRRSKALVMLTFSNIYFMGMVVYLIQDTAFLFHLIPLYWVVSYLGGYVSFHTIDLIRESQMLFERYKDESATDGLTGLNNVRRFNELFNQLVNEAESKKQPLSLLYVDIDFFKEVNDTYGHKEGDAVLKQLSWILQKSVRSTDLVSRNGGEEFTVLLVDCPLKIASEIAENIRKRVEENIFMLNNGEKIKVTVSVGVASCQDDFENMSTLIEDADKALYQAKKSGRNKVCVA